MKTSDSESRQLSRPGIRWSAGGTLASIHGDDYGPLVSDGPKPRPSWRCVDTAPYPFCQLCPLPAPVPTFLLQTLLLVFGESVRACPCLTLPQSQMPDLGVDLGALHLEMGKVLPCLRPFVVSRDSGHRWRRLDGEGMMRVLGSQFHPTLLVSWGPGSDTILFLSQPHKHAHPHPHSSPPWWLWVAGRAHWAGALLWFLNTHSVVSGPEEVLPQCGLQPSAVLLLSIWGSPGPLDTIAAAQAWLLRDPETPPSPAWPALPAQQPCRTTPFTRPHPLSSRILGSAFLCLSWSVVPSDRELMMPRTLVRRAYDA